MPENETPLANARLFRGLSAADVDAAARCLSARERRYRKGEIILHAGDVTREVGIVRAGSVRVESTDAWGNTVVLSRIGPGQAFAEVYACLLGEPMLVDAVAAEDARIAFLDAAKVLRQCASACPFHARIVENLVETLARKNLALSQRSFHVGRKTVRGKIVSYLSQQAVQAGSRSFDVPFNRQELADYLGVDRSVLSAELGRMQREGLLRTVRSHFELLGPEEG